jgi:hypothetical protein
VSDWEPFDDELAGRLRRRAGAVSNDPLATESAHRAVLARAGAVRRRRAAVAGSGTLVVVMVAGLLALTTGGPGDDALAPATDPGRATSLPESTAPATPGTTDGSSSEWTGSTVTLTVPPPEDTTQASATVTDAGSSTSSSTSVPGDTTPLGEYPYNSSGGSIVVGWDGTSLSLLTYSANSGYTAEVEDEQADRIRVRFRGDAGDVRIECRLIDGRLVRVE